MHRPDGLGWDEYDLYLDGLTRTHRREVELVVTDLEGNKPRTLAPLILSGQITVDRGTSPSRVLRVEFFDPDGDLPLDSGTVDNPIHRTKMIEVHDWRLVDTLGFWVDARPFTGVVYDYDREGAVVTITAHGKEAQGMGNRWSPRAWKKKRRKTDIIRQLAKDTGETRLRIPNVGARTANKVVVKRNDRPWEVMRRLAGSMSGRQLFYDGRGILILRRLPSAPVHVFNEDWLLGEIQVDRNPDGIFNVFQVSGRKPKGKKRKRPSATVWLPRNHPNSAHSLGRNGEPLRVIKSLQNNQLRSKKACRQKAKRMRDYWARQAVDASVDVLPIPCLDEGDLVRLSDGSQAISVRMNKWTLPLTSGGGMSVGSTKRVGTKSPKRHRSGTQGASGVSVLSEDY